jgi:hypothetical protein
VLPPITPVFRQCAARPGPESDARGCVARHWEAVVLKALSLTAMALWVLGSTAYHVLILGIPRAEVMGAIGILALAANAASVLILMRYKDGDANVRSAFLQH